MPSLLLVEDDQQLAELLRGLLTNEGYHVSLASDRQRGLHLGLTQPSDVLVLDRGLPDGDGLGLLEVLRAKGVTAPALILSARGALKDRVDGLDAGAEDYLAKPFEVEELLARLRALLRRHQDAAEELRIGTARLDLHTRVVTLPDAKEVPLSEREADLLATLARRPKQAFSREQLLGLVFDDAESAATIDSYVHYLRRKLGKGAVATVRGLGYRLGQL